MPSPVSDRAASKILDLEVKDARVIFSTSWDSLEEEMANSVEYDIVPDYDRLLDIMSAAKRAASGG